MSDLVPFERSDDRSYDEQMKDALEKALTIHGTVINDLNQALNCIIQMQRALRIVGAPNPYEGEAQRLLTFYKMNAANVKKHTEESHKLLEANETLELVEGEVVDDSRST
jgi:hypothetical protein